MSMIGDQNIFKEPSKGIFEMLTEVSKYRGD